MGDGAGTSSGEISPYQLLLQAVNDIRQEQRDSRQEQRESQEQFNAKLDQHGQQLSKILVDLAAGTGRMDGLDQAISHVAAKAEENRQKLKSMESGAYSRLAVEKNTLKPSSPGGGWIRVKEMTALIAALAALVVAVAAISRGHDPNAPSSATAPAPMSVHGQ